MPHKYANFGAAYADLAAGFDTAKQHKDWAQLNSDAAYEGASDPVDKTHFGYLCYAVHCLCVTFNYLAQLHQTDYLQSYLYESIYWAAQGNGAAEITMDAILDAMWDSLGGQTMTFITYIDAMRGSISEKTVFEPYLSSYLRHFL